MSILSKRYQYYAMLQRKQFYVTTIKSFIYIARNVGYQIASV